jgi:hypothetical protein
MKNKFIFSVLIACITGSSYAQLTEVRDLPAFSKIKIESVAKIFLRQDSVQSVKIVSPEANHDIETTVKDQTLRIDGISDDELYISSPNIEKISIDGKGEVIGQSLIRSNDLTLDISGDGKMNLEVQVKDLKTKISGLGKIMLRGTAENTRVTISGSGKVDAINLKTVNCETNISGIGKCMIDVTDNLTTDISGSGSISYKNPPKNISKNISGIGKINGYQVMDNKMDTTRLTFGDATVLVIAKKDSIHFHKRKLPKPVWQGFEMGINLYLDSKGNYDLPKGYEFLALREEKSVSVGLNLLQKNIQLGHSNVWFFTGMGITWNNYRFASNVILHSTSPISASYDTTSNVDHIKSKLTMSYLTVPFMFEAFTSRNPKKAFHIGAGLMTGIRLMSHTKMKYEIDGDVFKPKLYNDFGLDPFRLGVRAAIGFHRINLYTDYYFTSMFREGRGPSLYPINFGITLLGI